jgi:hypothetical protein
MGKPTTAPKAKIRGSLLRQKSVLSPCRCICKRLAAQGGTYKPQDKLKQNEGGTKASRTKKRYKGLTNHLNTFRTVTLQIINATTYRQRLESKCDHFKWSNQGKFIMATQTPLRLNLGFLKNRSGKTFGTKTSTTLVSEYGGGNTRLTDINRVIGVDVAASLLLPQIPGIRLKPFQWQTGERQSLRCYVKARKSLRKDSSQTKIIAP